MKLFPKQNNAIYYLKDKVTEEVLYGGAAGGGKSKLGCLWLIEMCQKYPGSRWLMGRAKLKALKESTLNTFFETAVQLNITKQYRYNDQSHIIKWNNGSQILLKDLFQYPSDPEFDSLGSIEITGAFIDECNQITSKAWQVVKSRIRYKLKEFDLMPKLLGTCNPAKNWTYQWFYKPSRDNELPPYRKFIKALSQDNPALPPSYSQMLLRLDEKSRERLYHGNWDYDSDPSALINMDAIVNYFNPSHIKAEGLKYMTIDVARMGVDKTVFRVWHGWLCIKRYEIAKSGLNVVVDKAREFQKEYGIPVSHVVVDEDGVGGGVVDFLRGCKGFKNNGTPVKVWEAGNYITPNFENIKTQCSVKMAEMISNGLTGEVCDNVAVVEAVTEEMGQVKLRDMDKDGKIKIVPKELIKKQLDRSPDDWDSIMMRYYFELNPPAKFDIR